MFLQVNRISRFFENDIKKPNNPKELEIYEDLDTKVRLIILDGVKDSLIPPFSGKNTAHEMWMTLQNLSHNKNENQVLILEDKLNSTEMIKGEGLTVYLTRLSQVIDEFVYVGVKILDGDMVRISLKGFTKQWKSFIKGIIF